MLLHVHGTSDLHHRWLKTHHSEQGCVFWGVNDVNLKLGSQTPKNCWPLTSAVSGQFQVQVH